MKSVRCFGRRQRRGDVDRHRGRADAALGAEKGKQLPGDLGYFLRREADDRGFERVAESGSVRHSLTPARIASRMSVGSSDAVTSTSEVAG